MPARYPAAILALSDVGGPVVNLGELLLNGTITSTASVVPVRTAAPSYWPASGIFIIDSEVIAYGAIAADRLSFTSCTRAQESTNGGGAAASHTDGSTIGMYQTALQYNQLVDEVRAIETQLGVNLGEATVTTRGFESAADKRLLAYFSAGNSGTALTIDWNNGASQHVTLTGNCTFTFSNPAQPGWYALRLAQDATGSRTVTWPATVKWSGATAPTLTTTASRVDLITLYWDGAAYLAASVLNFTV